MSRFDRLLGNDVLERTDPVPAPIPLRVRPPQGHPLVYATYFTEGARVWVRDPGDGHSKAFVSKTPVMPVPDDMASDDAIVTGDEIMYWDAAGHQRTGVFPTMQLGDFKVGNRCLMPTRIRTQEGRTCWMPVRIVPK